jgi:hypothetical protein
MRDDRGTRGRDFEGFSPALALSDALVNSWSGVEHFQPRITEGGAGSRIRTMIKLRANDHVGGVLKGNSDEQRTRRTDGLA